MIASFKIEHATRSSRIGVAAFGLAFVLLAAAPAWGRRDDLRLLSEIYAYVALASLWNLLAGYAGLVLFSYPLHPPGRPERTEARIAHWPAIECPVLLLSGEADPFARIELLRISAGSLF